MNVPELGDWVEINDCELGPGKVVDVKYAADVFCARFLRGKNLDEAGENPLLPFSRIVKVITSPSQIIQLERKLSKETG